MPRYRAIEPSPQRAESTGHSLAHFRRERITTIEAGFGPIDIAGAHLRVRETKNPDALRVGVPKMLELFDSVLKQVERLRVRAALVRRSTTIHERHAESEVVANLRGDRGALLEELIGPGKVALIRGDASEVM